MPETDGIFPVPMPHLGVSVTEGTVLEWHKAAGDQVAADEVICEISTDKVDTEVVAPADGTLVRIVAAAGDTVAVGDALAELAVGADAAATLAARPDDDPAAAPGVTPEEPDPSEQARPPEPRDRSAAPRGLSPVGPAGRFDPVAAAELVVASGERNGRPVSSPAARRLAEEHGIDLGTVRATGLRGRIRKSDVLAAIERGGETRPTRPARPAPSPAPAAAGELPRGYDDVPHEVVELSRLRSVMAEHMIRSRQTAAHMTTEAEVDMTAVSRVRAELNASRERRLTALSFIARATCSALAEFPDLNATFDDGRLIRWSEVNLGIAVDTEQGLIVPVIRGCERLTAPAIGEEIAEVASRARARKLTPDDVRAGTFTISNPGSVGAVSAMAIINQPQVAILGTPAVVRRPVVVADELGGEAIAIRPIMTLALTFDHRVIDGAYATRCVVRIKEHLESWNAGAYV